MTLARHAGSDPAPPRARPAPFPTRAGGRSEVDCLLEFLRPHVGPDTVLMEIGPRDCAVAMRAAAVVKQVYVIDVFQPLARSSPRPENFTPLLSDGCSVPVPPDSISVVLSYRLLEHLDAGDARALLENVHRSLAPGGIHLCITPNRLYEEDVPMRHGTPAALASRAYTAPELRRLLAGAGFPEVRFYARAWGRFLRCPYLLVASIESAIGWLPRAVRKHLAASAPLRALLGLRVAAIKAAAA